MDDQDRLEVSIGRPNGGEHAKLAHPSLGDDGEPGRGDEGDE